MKDLKLVLDIGNGYIKGVLFGDEDGKSVIVAKEMEKVQGMRKGKILDMNDFVSSIRSVIESFEKKLGGDYNDKIYVGISHPEMEVSRATEQKRIINDNIQQDDQDHLAKLIQDTSGKSNYEILKIIPVKWTIDESMTLKDPVGMEGKKLELAADVYMIPKNFYNNILEAFEKLEIDITDIIPNILGSTEAALDFDSKDLGTLLVDIGNNQTTYTVYEEGFPLLTGVVPVGGEEVTKDISIGLQMDIKEAEKIKREKGVILMEDDKADKDESIDVSFLSDVILARYEEIFEKINEQLVEIGRDGRLPGGVILIGGGTKIKNTDKLAKDQFKLASFYGKDKVLNMGDISSNVQFINVLGDYIWSNKYSEEGGGFNFGFNMSFGWLKNLYKSIKDMF